MSKIEHYRKKMQALELQRRDERLGIIKKNEIKRFENVKAAPKENSAFKEKYLLYLRSEEWLKIRLAMLKFYNFTCNRCKLKKHYKQLQVHHRTYKNVFHEEPEDLELICKKCHEKEHKIFK